MLQNNHLCITPYNKDGTVIITAKEYAVWCQVCNGLSNKEIGRILNIEADTVKVHLRNLFAKININNRVQLALYGVAIGMMNGLDITVQEKYVVIRS